MALKIRRNNTSILDTFNDEDIQKEYDNMKFAIIADNIDEAYQKYRNIKDYNNDIYSGYKPKSLQELKDWIKEQNNNGVEKLEVGWIDVSDMTDLRYCFSEGVNAVGYDFTKIEGLQNWDVSRVENMYGMFASCYSLTEINGLVNWDVHNVIDMTDMFRNCKNLTSLDLSKWDVSRVMYMDSMFVGCNESIIPSWYYDRFPQ